MACNATSELEIFEGLRLARFVFTLRALKEMTLPPYKGSMLRGVLGHGLLRVACQMGRQRCNLQCPIVHQCAYVYLFQTQRPPQDRILKGSDEVPRPYVLLPHLDGKKRYEAGEELIFSLVLVGRAIDRFPRAVEAFHRMGEVGLGADRGPYRLERVECVNRQGQRKVLYQIGQDWVDLDFATLALQDLQPPAISAGWLGLEFLTPTRIEQGNQLIMPKDFFSIFNPLVSRLNLLYHFHCANGTQVFYHFDALKERAKRVRTVSQEFHWHPQERYTGRQGQKNSIGGFVGRMAFEGDLEEFLPFLLLGEQLHIGKGTVYGCGKYVLSDFIESIQ